MCDASRHGKWRKSSKKNLSTINAVLQTDGEYKLHSESKQCRSAATYEINGGFKRAMGYTNPPLTFLIEISNLESNRAQSTVFRNSCFQAFPI